MIPLLPMGLKILTAIQPVYVVSISVKKKLKAQFRLLELVYYSVNVSSVLSQCEKSILLLIKK